MPHPFKNFNLRTRLNAVTAAVTIVFSLTIASISLAQAQTYKVIYPFGGCSDGNFPTSTLTLDRSGSLYGTTEYGGSACGTLGQGVVFRLKRAGGGWVSGHTVAPA